MIIEATVVPSIYEMWGKWYDLSKRVFGCIDFFLNSLREIWVGLATKETVTHAEHLYVARV